MTDFHPSVKEQCVASNEHSIKHRIYITIVKYFWGAPLNLTLSTHAVSFLWPPLQQLTAVLFIFSASESLPHLLSWTTVSHACFFHYCLHHLSFWMFIKLPPLTRDLWIPQTSCVVPYVLYVYLCCRHNKNKGFSTPPRADFPSLGNDPTPLRMHVLNLL